MENDGVKIAQDFHIKADHVIQHLRDNLVKVNKNEKKYQFINIDIPGAKQVEINMEFVIVHVVAGAARNYIENI